MSVKTLDAEVGKRRPKEAEGNDFLATIEPWPDFVEGAQLLDDLASVARRHVGLPEGGADAVALWVMHTHALDAAYITPVFAITSPTPECGKSTLLNLIGKLTPNTLPAPLVPNAPGNPKGQADALAPTLRGQLQRDGSEARRGT